MLEGLKKAEEEREDTTLTSSRESMTLKASVLLLSLSLSVLVNYGTTGALPQPFPLFFSFAANSGFELFFEHLAVAIV
jgi:hypothetical protein